MHSAPVVFFCQNNQWAISVPLAKQMAGPVYKRAFGFGFPGVQVDGNDVLAVYAVTRAAAERARDGAGPTLIEAITYRLGAHTTTDDPTRYRTSDELDMWKAREPIGRYRAFLERAGLWTEALEGEVQAEADRVAAEVRDTVEHMPRPAPVRPGRPRLRRSAGHPDGPVAPAGGVRGPVPGRGLREAPMAQITMAKALNTALRDAMEADDRVVLLGEDVGTLGGVFRITDGLLKDFGEQRVMDTPLAESAIMGVSIGLALRGYRPVPEMQFDGFSYPALDQIISHLAKYRNRSAGTQPMPVVCRIPYGGAIGAVEHHSESPEAIYGHTAGLKVVTPSLGRRRLLAAAPVDRERRPGDLPRAQAALLGQAGGRPAGLDRADRQGQGAAARAAT